MERLKRLDMLGNNIGLTCTFELDVYTGHFPFLHLISGKLYITFHNIEGLLCNIGSHNINNIEQLMRKWKD